MTRQRLAMMALLAAAGANVGVGYDPAFVEPPLNEREQARLDAKQERRPFKGQRLTARELLRYSRKRRRAQQTHRGKR